VEKSEFRSSKEFIGNTFLAPSQIVLGNFGDQLPNVAGNAWTPARPRLPFPK
jgi:hypothetical protein